MDDTRIAWSEYYREVERARAKLKRRLGIAETEEEARELGKQMAQESIKVIRKALGDKDVPFSLGCGEVG